MVLGVDELTIMSAMEVVERSIDEHSTKEEQDAFQVGVVILSFSLMLDCRERDPKKPRFLLPHLTSIDKLKQVNLAQCVLDCIGIAARKVQDAKRNGYCTCTVGGCCLVPQIFYLDLVNFGVDKAPPDVFPRIRCYGKTKLDILINLDKNCHSVNLSQWYGYYKRNNQVKSEHRRASEASGSRRRNKKYKSDRQSRKLRRYNALVKIVEDHHAGDGYIVEDLKRHIDKRKNLLLHLIADHMENESSSSCDESEEHTTSDVHGMEGLHGQDQLVHDETVTGNTSSKRPSRLPRNPGVWIREEEVGNKGLEVPAYQNDENVGQDSNMSQVGDKRRAEVATNSGSQSSKRCKLTGNDAEIAGNDSHNGVQGLEGPSALPDVEEGDHRMNESAVPEEVPQKDTSLDVHNAIKILVAEELGLLKDTCAIRPGSKPLTGLRRLKKRLSRRGARPEQVGEEKEDEQQDDNQEHNVVGSASNNDVPVSSSNADCNKEKELIPDMVPMGNEDVIIQDVLKDIETGEFSRHEEQYDEVRVEEERHVEVAVDEGKESTIIDELYNMDTMNEPEDPISDKTPQCLLQFSITLMKT
ncbi:uncharacterized protein LOC100830025 isoform X5 [Brachypodium distachyon]|uniref:uncharacterized protein LOC100830025 isoform X5 n=1 Tax=Brachypodium distachyon TaxID=15368 RepID=UPI000D0DB9FE|nr:uncharacterized protein LOC100830025 isoform X5 [Brachypodium distachyon]XP_024316606.1 uncharacterized protein LOC100830025 isoform X5 [Brachypodium distachyon]|eukprot:XP_024316605.1 uncharacterized protein LOC100830025 isoform X5 [Brachypodium distachyon]